MACDNRATRVLHIVNKWDHGGVERFVEGLIEGLPRELYNQSILSICTNISSSVRCEKYGPLSSRKDMFSLFSGTIALRSFFKEHSFDIIHIHASNASCYLFCAIAKKYHIPIRIVHSHNSNFGVDFRCLKQMAHSLLSFVYAGSETHRFACSEKAGVHLFGKRSFEIVPNGIVTSKYAFDSTERMKKRTLIGARPETLVVGCAGSLIEAKNPLRSLDIFKELHRKQSDSLLVFAGDGPMKERIWAQARRLGLESLVRLLGHIDDMSAFYNAFDVMLSPSLYEGLPLALVEAQCSGLPVVAADSITREVALLDSFISLPLSADNTAWADALLIGQCCEREEACCIIEKRGFTIQATLQAVEKVYSKN